MGQSPSLVCSQTLDPDHEDELEMLETFFCEREKEERKERGREKILGSGKFNGKGLGFFRVGIFSLNFFP